MVFAIALLLYLTAGAVVYTLWGHKVPVMTRVVASVVFFLYTTIGAALALACTTHTSQDQAKCHYQNYFASLKPPDDGQSDDTVIKDLAKAGARVAGWLEGKENQSATNDEQFLQLR